MENDKITSTAIVILNYNGKKHLEIFLPKVLASAANVAEVIIADNASTDESVTYLQAHFPSINLLQLDKNYGFAEGYNQAIKQVNHDVVILLNSDVEVEKGWIKPLVKVLKSDEKNAAVQPKILSFKNKKRFEHAGAAGGMLDFLGYPFCRGRIFLETEEDLGQYDRATEIFWASGAAMCIKRQVFIDIGGFDTSFFAHMEEIDLCWRLKQAGFRIQYQPDSHVYHLGGGTLDYDSPFKVYLNFRNSLFTIFKNVSVGKLFWLLPFRLILDGIAGVFYLKQGKFRLIFMIIKAHFSFYFAFFQMISRRNDSLQLIEKCRIAKENSAGYYNKSIVFQHFIAKKNKFTDIFTN